MNKKLISLNELAKELNVNKSKLAYYVSMELIRPIDKVGGMQIFDRYQVMTILSQIDGGKKAGMTLKQIKNEIKKLKQ